MDVQFTENKLIKLFIEVDDLYKAYWSYRTQNGAAVQPPRQVTVLSGSEVCTILVAYHYSGYKNFEYYYRQCITKQYADCFPQAPTYECFLSYLPKSLELLYLWLLYSISRSQRTGMYFIDSKKLQVCHLKREHSHKVFAGIAAKGKTSTGWFFGLKLHLVINNLGEIVAFKITSANVADNNHDLLKELLDSLQGYCVGDKGYLTALFDFFLAKGLHLIYKPRKNMKKLPVQNHLNHMLDKRAVVESVFDILMTICDIEHSRHRKPTNAFAHIVAALLAYQHLEQKPRVFFPSSNHTLKNAA